MSKTPQAPGLQYPMGIAAQSDPISLALRNIYDNLFYLRGAQSPNISVSGGATQTGTSLLVDVLANIPTLTDAEVDQVEFFATDYGHTYLWVGVQSSPTGWLGMDYDGDQLVMKMDGDSVFGCQICDGSTVGVSTVYGKIKQKQVPILNRVTPVFLAAAKEYSGTVAIPANAPSVVSATGTASAVSTVGGSSTASGTTGPGSPHNHDGGTYATVEAMLMDGATAANVSGQPYFDTGLTMPWIPETTLAKNSDGVTEWLPTLTTPAGVTDDAVYTVDISGFINSGDLATWYSEESADSYDFFLSLTSASGSSGVPLEDDLTTPWGPILTEDALAGGGGPWAPTLSVGTSGTVNIADLESALTHDHLLGGTTDNNNQDLTHWHQVDADTLTGVWFSGSGHFAAGDITIDVTTSVFSGTSSVALTSATIHSSTIDVDLTDLTTTNEATVTSNALNPSDFDLSHDHDLPSTTGNIDVWDTTSGTVAIALDSGEVAGLTVHHHSISAEDLVHYHLITAGSLTRSGGIYLPGPSTVSLDLTHGTHTHPVTTLTCSAITSHLHLLDEDAPHYHGIPILTVSGTIPSTTLTGVSGDESDHTHDATLTVDLSGVTVDTEVTIDSIDIEIAADAMPDHTNLLAYWRR